MAFLRACSRGSEGRMVWNQPRPTALQTPGGRGQPGPVGLLPVPWRRPGPPIRPLCVGVCTVTRSASNPIGV